MFYSIIHLSIGAILIGGILSYFSASSIEQSEKWFEDAEDEMILSGLREQYAKTGGSLCGRMVYVFGVAKLWIGDHRTSVGAWCMLIL